MSVEKSLSLDAGKTAGAANKSVKRRHVGRCFSFVEVSLEPGKQLKDMDSNKLKGEIKRWAKAVVAYARQVSGRFGSSKDKSQS
ncbi:60S ribosomal protein L28-2 isoform B [Senna tora]|uniref:60S ribosomal protein L28-2 isoform B n=1 Tax=Senna tora TaxID=362788 RepID=A0A834XF65_9FABA|nr:60S ribosomal protein L28-2 isoform B [Senna tora]